MENGWTPKTGSLNTVEAPVNLETMGWGTRYGILSILMVGEPQQEKTILQRGLVSHLPTLYSPILNLSFIESNPMGNQILVIPKESSGRQSKLDKRALA